MDLSLPQRRQLSIAAHPASTPASPRALVRTAISFRFRYRPTDPTKRLPLCQPGNRLHSISTDVNACPATDIPQEL